MFGQYIPHTSEKLDETSVTIRQSNNETGRSNAACVDVDQGQDKGGKSES